jgi:hypothetical protein
MGDHLLDVSGVKGVLGDGPFSATEVGYAASLLVQSMLAARPSELGVVIYIVGRSAYERGYPAEVNTHVQRAIIGDYQRVDFYTLVLDEDKSVTIHPLIYTAHGGVYRELALTAQELQGAQLYGTAVKMVTDRIALER